MIPYILITYFITEKCKRITYKNGKKKNPEENHFHDLGHYYLPDLDDYHIIPDIIVGLYIIAFLYFGNIESIKEMALLMCIIFVFRSILVISTSIPDASGICEKKKFQIGYCNDLMFSGHTATVTLISLYLMSIFPNKRNMLILGNIITYILIIASKNHYTIDVLVGSYVSTTLYFLRDKILR